MSIHSNVFPSKGSLDEQHFLGFMVTKYRITQNKRCPKCGEYTKSTSRRWLL